MLTCLEIGATMFGLLQGWLVLKNKRSNWIAYMIQMLFMVFFSLNAKLYGDMVNSFVYFFIGLIGYILWKKENHRKIKECTWKERGLYILITVIATFFVYYSLKSTSDPLPLIDAFTTVSSFVATYYMVTKKIDTWIIWFVNDISYVITYWLLPNQAFYLLGLNLIWTGMAVGSYINWKKIMKGEIHD